MTADFKQASNLAGKVLASGQVASAATDTTIYTVPASSAVKLATISLHNSGAATVTVNVSLVPSGGTVDGTHRQLTAYALVAGDTISHEDVLSFLKGAMIDAGAFVSVNASVGATVNHLITGAVSS